MLPGKRMDLWVSMVEHRVKRSTVDSSTPRREAKKSRKGILIFGSGASESRSISWFVERIERGE